MPVPFAAAMDAVLHHTMLLPWPIPDPLWERIEQDLTGRWTPIYALMTKPRLVVLPGTIRQAGPWIHCAVSTQCATSFHKAMRAMVFPADMVGSFIAHAGRDSVALATTASPTPHAALTCMLAQAAGMMHAQDWLGTLLDFRVEYIGQTRRPWRRGTHRLRRHHVMRKLERFVPVQQPEDELWVAVFAFARPQAISMAGQGIPADYEPPQVTFTEPLKLLDRRQWRNLIEAALIHQFRPAWNRTFLRKFPHRSHRSYRWFQETGIQTALISMNEGTVIRFGTAARPPQRTHCFSVPFRQPLAAVPTWSELRPDDATDDAWRWQLWSSGRCDRLPQGPPPESLHHLLRP